MPPLVFRYFLFFLCCVETCFDTERIVFFPSGPGAYALLSSVFFQRALPPCGFLMPPHGCSCFFPFYLNAPSFRAVHSWELVSRPPALFTHVCFTVLVPPTSNSPCLFPLPLPPTVFLFRLCCNGRSFLVAPLSSVLGGFSSLGPVALFLTPLTPLPLSSGGWYVVLFAVVVSKEGLLYGIFPVT